MTLQRYILALSTQIRSSADATTSAVKKVRFMKLYKYLMLVGLLAIAATGANAGPIGTDPTVILRGGGGSFPVGPTFGGTFAKDTANNINIDNITYNNISGQTFTDLVLLFTVSVPASLTYSCDTANVFDQNDPFFTTCTALAPNKIEFSGMDMYHSGILAGDDFNLYIPDLPDPSSATFVATADVASGTTPEPASLLLFVIAIGAIAIFFKRA
jgi:hypothetical protein